MNEMLAPQRNEIDRWSTLVRESETGVAKYLSSEIDTDLAAFIRCITFRVFLVVFLDVDPNTLEFPNVELVTRALSNFYDADRQRKNTLPPDAKSILHVWLPCTRFPSSLDRILPAYEALWRIIATIVVTCEDDDSEERVLRWVMLDFRDNPRDRQYRASLRSDGKSVSTITDDVVRHLKAIAGPQQLATTPNWLLNCIQNAFGETEQGSLTVDEALKFAALLASRVIGRVGVHYEISGDRPTDSQAPPWDRRKISGRNRTPQNTANNVIGIPPHFSSSKWQNH